LQNNSQNAVGAAYNRLKGFFGNISSSFGRIPLGIGHSAPPVNDAQAILNIRRNLNNKITRNPAMFNPNEKYLQEEVTQLTKKIDTLKSEETKAENILKVKISKLEKEVITEKAMIEKSNHTNVVYATFGGIMIGFGIIASYLAYRFYRK